MTRKTGLILGDQLSDSIATLTLLDRQRDLIVMAEVASEATYVKHHKQKIALIFSAMRHFAQRLRDHGWQVHYHEYRSDSAAKTLLDVVSSVINTTTTNELVITECGDYRLQHEMTTAWQSQLCCPVTILEDRRFVSSRQNFADWAGGRKQLRMEYFYRDMRRSTGLLMDGDKPIGGEWNFDSQNRQPFQGKHPLHQPEKFTRDNIDNTVLNLVAREFADHPGSLTNFNWPTTREQALLALTGFIEHRLPLFGDYQDAMVQNQHTLFHSLLSTSLNCGLLTPLEVCRAAEQAYMSDTAPLNAVEGFIRQIIGWREYVRGLYWLLMPDYASNNHFGNTRPLPDFYWHGDTRMNCMQQCFINTFDNAYAHHIQRLMITGNFALLAGITPAQVCDWYLAVYADAFDWVELPNTLGMVMHADGGIMASKPYAASGSYINRMSDYCKHCQYNVKTVSEPDSCPFNSLYWHFINRHGNTLRNNPRMTMIYRSYAKMDDDKKQRIQLRATQLLEQLNDL